ncbi:MAG: hypothetical protein KME38_22470 [Spirirestis rafaelensis WJT71-NPBG6]|jgi:hypothetical protein|nr:hypothetical protein [Spirirestis rafaelensis WJT71-NPBG6]
MVSPWQSPLPLEEHKTSRVVVYFYSDRLGLWIPIVFFRLVEAIAFHRKGLLKGAEFFVFSPDLDPCNCGLETGEWGIRTGECGLGIGQSGLGAGDKYELPMPYALCPMPYS